MGTPPLSETPSAPINIPANNVDSLRSELNKRGKQVESKAMRYLACAVFVLLLGGVGIFFAPEFIQRDREKLQSETVKRALASNIEKIDAIDEELDKLQKIEDLEDLGDRPRLSGVELADNGRMGAVVGSNVILTTEDGGITWIRRDGDITIGHEVALSSDGGTGVAVGWGGLILMTGDGGISWDKRASGTNTFLLGVALSSDGGTGIAVGDGGVMLFTEDGGTTWDTRDSGVEARLENVALSSDGGTGIAVGSEGVILTTDDGGITWSRRDSGTETTLMGVALDSAGRMGVVVGGDGVILTTDDGGTTWSRRDSGIETALEGVAVSADGRSGIAVGWRGVILTTRDGGTSWVKREIARGKRLQDVALGSDGRTGIVVGLIGAFEGTILNTADGGVTWRNPQEVRDRNRDRLLMDRTGLVRENQNLELGLVRPASLEQPDVQERITASLWTYLTLTASWRLPTLVLSVFLARILFGISRYHTRLAAFYSARADALSLLNTENDSVSLEAMERAAWVLSPHQVDFAGTPQTISQQATDLFAPQNRFTRW